MMDRIRGLNTGWISIAIFILIWELVATYGIVDPLYIGTPHLILGKAGELLSDPKLLKYMFNSGQAFLAGYFSAVIVGCALGFLFGIRAGVKKAFYPFISILNATPFVAVLPLIIIWFGLGVPAKSFLVFLMVLTPMVIYTLDSLGTVDKGLLVMAETFGLSTWQKITKIYYYHSLPYIFSGARIGIGRGLIAVIIAEMYGLGRGIAYFIPYYGATYQTDKLLANILFFLVLNFILLRVLKAVRTKLVFWE